MTITHPGESPLPDDGSPRARLAALLSHRARDAACTCAAGRSRWNATRPASGARVLAEGRLEGLPDWLSASTFPKKDGVVHHPVVTDVPSLLRTANQNTITHHVWTSRVPRLQYPDICVFDLDPSTDDVASVRAAAIGMRDLLEELTLASWIKTTGSKGFHIVIPLDGQHDRREAACFVDAVGKLSESCARQPHAGVQQGRSARAHLRRHLEETATTDVCRRTPSVPNAALRCRRRTLKEARARRGRAGHVHAAEHARTRRENRRRVGGHAAPREIAEAADRQAGEDEARDAGPLSGQTNAWREPTERRRRATRGATARSGRRDRDRAA